MASTGNTSLNKGTPLIQGAFVIIVKTEWNAHIVDRLEEGCRKVLEQNGITTETIVVPGAVEIPFAVRAYAGSTAKQADAFVALGAVIRGGTPHFDYVCNMVTDGVGALNLTLDTPVIFGVLTVDNEEQALDRIGGAHGHKGEEAAATAITMIGFNRNLSRKNGNTNR